MATCSNCGSNDFVWASRVRSGMTGAGRLSLRGRSEAEIGTRICRGCGHADLFVRDLELLRSPHKWRRGEFVSMVAEPVPRRPASGAPGGGAPRNAAPAAEVRPPPVAARVTPVIAPITASPPPAAPRGPTPTKPEPILPVPEIPEPPLAPEAPNEVEPEEPEPEIVAPSGPPVADGAVDHEPARAEADSKPVRRRTPKSKSPRKKGGPAPDSD